MNRMLAYIYFSFFICFYTSGGDAYGSDINDNNLQQDEPLNIIFVLSDDHRYDMMGFMNTVPYLETPSMDRMALQGAHIKNAFVNTSLCSPSRASILTGQYTHRHGVVDNSSPVPDSATFFPEHLQNAGYQTGFVGKWHMGHATDEPRRGFDFWVSFRGQGVYFNPTLNENGKRVHYKDSTYISEILTDKSIEFLEKRNREKPFFLFLSHKAVHAKFKPSPKDNGKLRDKKINYPATMFPPDFSSSDAAGKGYHPKPEDLSKNIPGFTYKYEDLPEWVKERRNSRHGVNQIVDNIPYDEFYYRYLESILGVDRSIGRILDYLEEHNLLESTVVIYMGDNGYSLGEHGLIDKRHAYEESWRVPLLAYAPGYIEAGTKVKSMIENIDVAPTIMELSGLKVSENMDGESFLSALKRKEGPDKNKIYYEYYWERTFPQTPTIHAVRTDSFKYIRYYGIWDNNELYNIAEDPEEAVNLIHESQYQDLADELNQSLFDWLSRTGGMNIPLKRDERPMLDRKSKGHM